TRLRLSQRETLMTQTIVIGRSTRFYIKYSTQNLLKEVTPFIRSIAEDIAVSDDFENTVLRAADSYPDAAKYFVVEPGKINETFGLEPGHLFADYRPEILAIDAGSGLYE